jgi:TonB family protein
MRKRQLTVICALAALTTAPAMAQDREANWLRRPTPETLRAVYPGAALQKGQSGSATISCTVTVQGALRGCTVVAEKPAGSGFGGAAVALAPQFLMRPALKDGVPVESTVRIPINWDLGGMGRQPKPAQSDKIYTNLPYRAAPSFEQVLAAYPAKARAGKVGGSAILDCRITKAGRLEKCTTIREQPQGQGFATAAKSLSTLFETPVDTGDGGTAAGAHAHLKVTFAAAGLDAGASVIGKPRWVAAPRVNDIMAVVPEAALKAKVFKARVVMKCKVVAEGHVDGCGVQSQEPAGLGYDRAALRLSPFFRLAVWSDEGLPTVGGDVLIPLRFDLEAAMAEAAASKP